MRLVTVHMPPEFLHGLDELVRLQKYPNRSEAIRVAIRDLLKDELSELKKPQIALTSNEIEFLKPVFPGETVIVNSEKIYFRFGKLKCKVTMKNDKGETVCQGTIAGMIKKAVDEK